MKLILTAPVDKLGTAGDIVEVKDGYGRNYLVPRGLAIRWSRGGEKQIEGIRRAREARQIRGVEHAEELASQLAGLQVSLPVRAGQTGKLFGAVTANDIASAIRAAGGPLLDRRAIEMREPIKSLGRHAVEVKLHDTVNATVNLEVVPQG